MDIMQRLRQVIAKKTDIKTTVNAQPLIACCALPRRSCPANFTIKVFAITCLNLYIMSIYLSNIYNEIKQRPLYIIESIKRFQILLGCWECQDVKMLLYKRELEMYSWHDFEQCHEQYVFNCLRQLFFFTQRRRERRVR